MGRACRTRETGGRSAPVRLRGHRGFRLSWAATTVSGFGSYVSTLAVQVIVLATLAGWATDLGLVGAAGSPDPAGTVAG